jgi:hypothetical protein
MKTFVLTVSRMFTETHKKPSYNQPFILVGFEESQAITSELRFRGYNAFSCDLQDCSGSMPEFHLKMDIFQAINLRKWDMIILHPPCTFTALCGNRWYWNSSGNC